MLLILFFLASGYVTGSFLFYDIILNSMEEKTTLYHVNTNKKIEEFSVKDTLIISKHKADKNYAGYGMYFWDNRGNADYWLGEKLKYEEKQNLCLVVVSVEYNSEVLLDLMDNAQEKLYADILEKLEKSGKFQSGFLGDKVDYLCQHLGCKLVRFSTYYPNTPKTGMLKRSRVTNQNKVIYCIKEPHYDIIKSKQKEVFS